VLQIIIYANIGLVVGFALAWFIRSLTVAKLKKQLHNTEGSWQREKLMKETAQKENVSAYAMHELAKREYDKQLQQAHDSIKIMDNDILLLQKNNEETEALLKAGNPEVHHLKLQLIEANNTIARHKAQLGLK
jgi:methylphosphotriester-DNA--protein-cysteine methyltransferase